VAVIFRVAVFQTDRKNPTPGTEAPPGTEASQVIDPIHGIKCSSVGNEMFFLKIA
jgi:hypothetical protein